MYKDPSRGSRSMQGSGWWQRWGPDKRRSRRDSRSMSSETVGSWLALLMRWMEGGER